MNTNVADETQGKELLRAMSTTIAQKIASCAAHVMLEDGATVLDAGCADGLATAWFAEQNPKIQVIGIDYDATFINKAQARFSHLDNLEFIQADLRNFDLGGRPLNAILNLSILHEPYSYTGYRVQTVEDILRAELNNLSPGGILINRDFMLPATPNELVYLAVEDKGETGDTPEEMSYPDLLQLYSREAMCFDNGDPEGHIKGFFLEEHSERLNKAALELPQNWRIFYLPHGFAWEYIWRKEYKSRFFPEANEKYGYWTAMQHRREAEKLGCRVLFCAPYENPWILENWYAPRVHLLDKKLKALPLPPSNFISVMQKPASNSSFYLCEHRQATMPPAFLQMNHYINETNGQLYDMVKRPGTDVVDVIPWHEDQNGQLFVFAKCDYPRPISNTQARRMTANLDGKQWSGHMIEPLTAAPNDDWFNAVKEVLFERAEFDENDVGEIRPALTYYTAPAELNECVRSATVEIKKASAVDRSLTSNYSGFSSDGSVRRFEVQQLLQAIQVGMLAEARLEMNIYELCRHLQKPVGKWLGPIFTPPVVNGIHISSFQEARNKVEHYKVFKETEDRAGWLDIVRSEFHERELVQGRERAVSKRELEFVVPNPLQTADVSTNSVTISVVVKDASTDKLLLGIQKIDNEHSQFPAVQVREKHSGHICLPGFRLPSSVDHIQWVNDWVATELGVKKNSVRKLGESYFPSLGVLPNRIFPCIVTETSARIEKLCDFYFMDELFDNLSDLKDAHTIVAIYRIMHALKLL